MAHDGAATPLLESAADPPRRNMYPFACATLASMTTVLMGYSLAVMSGAELFTREDLGLTDEQIEVLPGSMNVFMLSILVATSLSDRIGRRPLLLSSAGGVAAAMASLAASLRLGGAMPTPAWCAASVLAFVVAFSVGFGPLGVFMYVRLPETRGRSLEDMEVLFAD